MQPSGLKYQTVLDNLDIPLGTVRSRVPRARERIQSRFNVGNADALAA
jgi:DNA-directed RNA polymerase specialized sigma24 family protein